MIDEKQHTELLANYITRKLLKNGYRVHRLDAVTTSSHYLKVDCGMAGTIRVASHYGRPGMRYRYNIGPHIKESRVESAGGSERFFLTEGDVETLMMLVGSKREEMIEECGGEKEYRRTAEKSRRRGIRGTSRFWKKCYEVTRKGTNLCKKKR